MNPNLKGILLQSIGRIWPKKVAPRVIYHHSIHPSLPGSLSPDCFGQHLAVLQENGYQFLTFSDLVRKVKMGKSVDKAVSVTFDDGYLDNFEYALPILLEQGIPATFFVVSAIINVNPENSTTGNKLYPSRRMMTKQHLREMVSQGMEVASHTRTHVHVRHTLEASKNRAWDEIAGSRKELEDITGVSVHSFAYPNGQRGVFNAATRDLLLEAGYKFAATTIWGYVNQDCDPLEVSRMEIKANDNLDTFIAKATGRQDFRRWIHLIRDGSRKW